MLYCNECKNAFGELELRFEYTGVYHAGAREKEAVCPHCGSLSYEDAELCEYCGEWQPVSTMHRDIGGNGGVCDACYKGAIVELRKAASKRGGAYEDVLSYLLEVS